MLGTITQFGYLDYSQDEGTLYLLGQDTTNTVKAATIVLNTLYDYANDGAWLPMIAADGVPAYIKAKNGGGGSGGVITDPVSMKITVSIDNYSNFAQSAVIEKANAAILELDKQIQQAGGGAEIGELMTARHPPSEAGWLLCDGGEVPAAYPALSALLGGTLPEIPGGRYKTYIFGGTAVGLTQTGTKGPPAAQV